MSILSLKRAKLAVPSRCELGEGPLWDDRRERLFWTDIDRGELHIWNPLTRYHEPIYRGDPVGGFTLEEDGALALFRVRDIARFDPEVGRITASRPFADPGSRRFNDVTADFKGRVYAGTLGPSETGAGLFRFDPDGSSVLLFRGTGCSNGMGFSPNRKTFYWTCSTRSQVFAYDYDEKTGNLSNERPLIETLPEEGIADGLCVDAAGSLWSARWEGFGIVEHRALDGSTRSRIEVPVPRVTSCCLGGKGGKTLFITTARDLQKDTYEQAGGVFACEANAPALPLRRSRLFCSPSK